MADNGEAVPSRRLLTRSTSYIPYGEIFVEESSAGWQSPFYFNSKELDEETGLYYYGARYLDPTGAMWLSVDPVFHAGTSPYAYCLGNPVVMVDPDGRDEWTVDQEGVISKIGENTDVDIFYGLDSEGNRVSEISFSYRTIESINEDFKSYKDGDFSLSYINVNNSDSAKDLFEFLSQPSSFDAEDNTGKEWSLLIMDGENILSSSHEPSCERAGYEILKNKTGECVLFEHYHCHPNNNPFPSGTADGNGDIPFMKLLKKWGIASDVTLFSIYLPKEKRYREYYENSTYEMPELEIVAPRIYK